MQDMLIVALQRVLYVTHRNDTGYNDIQLISSLRLHQHCQQIRIAADNIHGFKANGTIQHAALS